jgi:uncharacterized phage-associated protein
MAKRYKASDVARYFLAKQDPDAGDTLSNLKLQKLCYYAQGLSMATRSEPLFDDGMEAWLHGPVVPSLYHEYKGYGANPIPPIDDLDIDAFDPADRMILDDVHTFYGQFSGWRLRQMTHEEAPWREAYEEHMNHEITLGALKAHFDGEVDESYRDKYGQISRGHAD